MSIRLTEPVHATTELITQFGGGVSVPTIETFPEVDVEALTSGDEDPLYVILQISEVGRVSRNGIVYDEYVVSEIEKAIRQGGVQGLMGHLPLSELDSAFPHSDTSPTPLAGFWVGVKRVSEILWGKAYIPPGKVREYIRRLKATGGKLGVSFFGKATVDKLEDGTRRLRNFQLETLDFAPATRASLELAGDFDVTREIESFVDRETNVSELINIQDIPHTIREQIVREAQIQADAQRVQELENTIQQNEEMLAEMREYGAIVTEIHAELGDETDVVEVVRQMNETMARLTELLGADVNIITRIEEYHRQIAEIETERFNNAVNQQVAELTNWNVSGEAGQQRLEALRNGFRAQVIAQMGDDRTPDRIPEIAQSVWDNGYQVIAESVRDSLAGPSAFIGGTANKPQEWKPADNGQTARNRLGI